MKKIVVIILLLVIPLITVEKVNNKNYYLETETDTYTKEEIDNKINELKNKIDSNATNIIETKSILTEIKNKLNDYALKTSLNKTNEDIENLLTLANQNKTRIDSLEDKSKNYNLRAETIYKASSERSGTTFGTLNYNVDLTNSAYIKVAVYTYIANKSNYYPFGLFYLDDNPENFGGIGGYDGTLNNGYGLGYLPTMGITGTKNLVIKNYSGTLLWLDEITVYYYE